MDQLSKLGPFAALSKLWNELNNGQRAILVSFVAVAVVVIGIVAMLASKPRMSVLFSGLESEDAGAIVQKLNDDKIQYQLSADGSAIEVPSDKVYDLRLKMASQGLPQGGNVGFELFDKSNFGMTEFTERVTYQRAMQGELTRTIKQLAPVTDARVILTIPEDKVYSSEQEPSKASVALKLKRGMPLSDDQVAGIVHLVSSAVEGMRPENVTVVDSEGNILSEESSTTSGGGRLTTTQSKMKRQYEDELSQNLQSMLAKIVGPDKVVVRVSADLNFDQKQTKAETFEPVAGSNGKVQGVLLSEDKSSEVYSGRVVPPANVPNNAVSSSPGDNYNRSQSTAQYEVSKRVEETVSAPGQLQRLSVAVLVDESVNGAQLAKLRQAVTAAAGVDQTRGDQVTVQNIAFDTSTSKAADAEMAKASKSELIKTLAKDFGAALLLIVFLFILRSIVKQIKIQAPPEPAPSVVIPEFPEAMPNPAELFQEQAPVFEQPPVPQKAEAFSTARINSDIPQEIAQSTPEDLAKLVRTWMSEP